MKLMAYLATALAVTIVASSATGRAQQPATSASPSSLIDPNAMAGLDRMGAYLRTLTAFQVQATTSLEDVRDSGLKVTSDGTVDLLVRRPNRLRAEISSDAQHRMFFYDGKSFSIWARRANYYATVPAPPALSELVDRLADKYGIEMPLVDLFYWGTDKSSKASDIKVAVDVGASQVQGTSCEHYAFRQDGLDWQIWLQSGEFPLPRKLVLTTTSDEARPQYTSVMTWTLAPAFNDAAFEFEPPSDAQKITLTNTEGR